MVFAMVGMFCMAILEFFHLRVDAKSCKVLELKDGFADVEGRAKKNQAEEKDAANDTRPSGAAANKEEEKWSRHQRNAVIVEASILVHSVLIGFDLGLQVTTAALPTNLPALEYLTHQRSL